MKKPLAFLFMLLIFTPLFAEIDISFNVKGFILNPIEIRNNGESLFMDKAILYLPDSLGNEEVVISGLELDNDFEILHEGKSEGPVMLNLQDYGVEVRASSLILNNEGLWVEHLFLPLPEAFYSQSQTPLLLSPIKISPQGRMSDASILTPYKGLIKKVSGLDVKQIELSFQKGLLYVKRLELLTQETPASHFAVSDRTIQFDGTMQAGIMDKLPPLENNPEKLIIQPETYVLEHEGILVDFQIYYPVNNPNERDFEIDRFPMSMSKSGWLDSRGFQQKDEGPLFANGEIQWGEFSFFVEEMYLKSFSELVLAEGYISSLTLGDKKVPVHLPVENVNFNYYDEIWDRVYTYFPEEELPLYEAIQVFTNQIELDNDGLYMNIEVMIPEEFGEYRLYLSDVHFGKNGSFRINDRINHMVVPFPDGTEDHYFGLGLNTQGAFIERYVIDFGDAFSPVTLENLLYTSEGELQINRIDSHPVTLNDYKLYLNKASYDVDYFYFSGKIKLPDYLPGDFSGLILNLDELIFLADIESFIELRASTDQTLRLQTPDGKNWRINGFSWVWDSVDPEELLIPAEFISAENSDEIRKEPIVIDLKEGIVK